MSDDKKMSAEEFIKTFAEIGIPTKSIFSKRAIDWLYFSGKILDHIEQYTVPQYGDKGHDLCSEYTVEECLRQARKYIERYGKNAREGQQELDFLKAVHFIQMGYEKYMSQQENK